MRFWTLQLAAALLLASVLTAHAQPGALLGGLLQGAAVVDSRPLPGAIPLPVTRPTDSLRTIPGRVAFAQASSRSLPQVCKKDRKCGQIPIQKHWSHAQGSQEHPRLSKWCVANGKARLLREASNPTIHSPIAF